VLSQQLLNSIFGNVGAAIKAGKKPQTGGCNPDSDAGSFKCVLNAMGQTLLLFGGIESDDPEALPGENPSSNLRWEPNRKHGATQRGKSRS